MSQANSKPAPILKQQLLSC